MRRLSAVLVVLASVALADVLLKQGGTSLGPVTTLNCSTNVTCSRVGGVGTIMQFGGTCWWANP